MNHYSRLSFPEYVSFGTRSWSCLQLPNGGEVFSNSITCFFVFDFKSIAKSNCLSDCYLNSILILESVITLSAILLTRPICHLDPYAAMKWRHFALIETIDMCNRFQKPECSRFYGSYRSGSGRRKGDTGSIVIWTCSFAVILMAFMTSSLLRITDVDAPFTASTTSAT